jgi:predicted AAA+ superfamily ATPase
LYDDHDDIHIIATGSSILEVSKGQSDLSRRAIIHHLNGFNFREFLVFEKKINLPSLSLETILKSHNEISADLLLGFPSKIYDASFLFIVLSTITGSLN